MSIYATLDPETQFLVDLYEEAAYRYGVARSEENRADLERTRNDALDALRDDFRRVQMEADHATAGVGE